MSVLFSTTQHTPLFFGADTCGSKLGDLLALSPDMYSRYTVFPGFCDVHVHFREPGFSYKETILSGCQAAAHGGYTAVCTMPNVNPVPDSAEHLAKQTALITRDACVHVYPYGAITVARQGKALSDMEGMSPSAIAFSDDGSGVQDDGMMKEAMLCAKSLDKLIVAHCEDNSLLHGGCIHEGTYAAQHGFVGISSESEYRQIERDLKLVEETGCGYHVCHISTAESVSLIRDAKARGLNVTCETAPHYLTHDESALQDNGRFKMNPPLRGTRDKKALLDGVIDGTIDIIATDHAPHSAAEKAKGLVGSAFGISGLETAFSALYTYLVRENVVSLEKLIDMMAMAPRRRFRIPLGDDYTVWDLQEQHLVNPEEWLSQGKASLYEGESLYGRCIATVCDGKVAWSSF